LPNAGNLVVMLMLLMAMLVARQDRACDR